MVVSRTAPRPRKTTGAVVAAATKTPRKTTTVPAAAFVAPTESVAAELARTVNGFRVVDDRPHRDAAGRLQARYRALTLSDGSKTIGCADCDETGVYTDVLHHRQDTHGDRRSGRRPAAAPTPVPPVNVLGMTVGELVNLGHRLEEWEATTERLTAERDRAVAAKVEAETELKALKKQLGKAAALLGSAS